MSTKKYAIQVTHQVTEVFEVDATSSVDANTKLGMHIALTNAGAKVPDDLDDAVTPVKTTRTVKHISQARTLIDEPAAT